MSELVVGLRTPAQPLHQEHVPIPAVPPRLSEKLRSGRTQQLGNKAPQTA